MFSEAQFSGWMTRWCAAVAEVPAWREISDYRGTSALDLAYLNMYFGIMDWMCRRFDQREQDLDAATSPYAVDRASSYESAAPWPTKWVAAARATAAQATERWRLRGSPSTIESSRADTRTALVIRAARNPTGFPVMRALQDDCGWNVRFAGWNPSLEAPVRALGMPYIDLRCAYARSCAVAARAHEKQIDAALRRLDSRDLSRLFSEISGLPVSVNLTPMFRDLCVTCRVQVDTYFDLLSRVNPALTVVFNESTLRERAAIRVAAQRGVKTVALQHGLYIGHVYRPLATDGLIVWGRIPREFWLALGSEPSRVISAGAFGHESWTEIASSTRVPRIAGEPPTVLLLGQNPASDISRGTHRASINAFFDAAARLPNVRFVLRPHPAESLLPYERVRSGSFANVTIRGHEPLVPALQGADVVVTVFSTAGLEAMLLGTPVVVLNAQPEPSVAPYASVADVARTGEELAGAVSRLIDDDSYRESIVRTCRQYAFDYFGPIDGSATSRAAAAIDRIATSHTDSAVEPIAQTAEAEHQSWR